MPDAEQVLWKELRKYSLGWRFRRQFPIPPYIVDFACVDARLIVEADGGQHGRPGDHDMRDCELRRQRWRVLRFWNNEILANTQGVLMTIAEMLGPPRERSPHPHPPPPAGGGGPPDPTSARSWGGPGASRERGGFRLYPSGGAFGGASVRLT